MVVPPKATQIHLEALLESDDYASYQAVIRRVTKEQVWMGDKLKSRPGKMGRVVALPVPSDLLPSGDYLLFVSGKTPKGGLESVNEYPFRIVR